MYEPGARIDDLEVDALLGTGSAAAIYRVRDGQDGSLAALKIAHSIDPTIRARMLTEGRILQLIRHSNVIAVRRVLTVGERPALLMDLVEGPTLAAWLDASGRPALPDALELFKGIARGVQAAHYRGLIHRDLNPNNILLSVREDGRVLPVLVDFGLARPIDRLGTGPTLQGPLGTVSYMAPEQMTDGRSADVRSDLYALGCILYELCIGGRAFQGSLFEVHRKSQAGEYVHPCDAREDMPHEIAEIITRMLQPDPEDRYQSIQDLMEDLYEGPPPMMTDESSQVFQMWSLSDVTDEASDLTRRLAPQLGALDGVADAMRRDRVRRWTELFGGAAAVVVCLAALAGTVAFVMG